MSKLPIKKLKEKISLCTMYATANMCAHYTCTTCVHWLGLLMSAMFTKSYYKYTTLTYTILLAASLRGKTIPT